MPRHPSSVHSKLQKLFIQKVKMIIIQYLHTVTCTRYVFLANLLAEPGNIIRMTFVKIHESECYLQVFTVIAQSILLHSAIPYRYLPHPLVHTVLTGNSKMKFEVPSKLM